MGPQSMIRAFPYPPSAAVSGRLMLLSPPLLTVTEYLTTPDMVQWLPRYLRSSVWNLRQLHHHKEAAILLTRLESHEILHLGPTSETTHNLAHPRQPQQTNLLVAG